MTKTTDDDVAVVKRLALLLDENRLTEIDYERGDFRVRVVRVPGPGRAAAPTSETSAAPAAPAPTPGPAEENLAAHPGAVRSPMVGTIYLSPQPGSPPFVRVGDTVTMGQTLLIIEAMKVMNQIRAPKAGRIARILVEDSGPIEFGQVAMLID
jgi:acetyl-CoA carboxylase biotin carboxyl carrier protein